MNLGKILVGAIVLIIAVWLFLNVADPAAKYVGGGILALIGLLSLISGLKRKS